MQLLASAVALSAVVLPSLAQGPAFMVNTPPSCTECAACRLSWQEQPNPLPPFVLSVLPAGQTPAPPLIPPVTINDTSVTFAAPFQQNTQITIKVTDAQGNNQFSSPFPIVAGPTSSCVNNPSFNAFPGVPGYTVGNIANSSSGSSSGSSSSTSSTSTGPSTTRPTSGTNSPSSGTSSTTSPSGSPTQTSSATALNSSFFGLFGLFVAAFLA